MVVRARRRGGRGQMMVVVVRNCGVVPATRGAGGGGAASEENARVGGRRRGVPGGRLRRGGLRVPTVPVEPAARRGWFGDCVHSRSGGRGRHGRGRGRRNPSGSGRGHGWGGRLALLRVVLVVVHGRCGAGSHVRAKVGTHSVTLTYFLQERSSLGLMRSEYNRIFSTLAFTD